MKKIAVIVAGGSGQRMGTDIPKQFLLLHGKPVLHYTIKAFKEAFDDMHFILVLPEVYINKATELLQDVVDANFKVIAGGATRFHSVQNGLQLIDEAEEAVVFIHDGVRCLVTADLIKHCHEQTLAKGNAVPAITSTDSVRILNGDATIVAERHYVKLIQTPQTFLSSIILPAYKQEYNTSFTDEATVAEANGSTIFLIEGETNNIKITRPIDLIVAAEIFQPSAFQPSQGNG